MLRFLAIALVAAITFTSIPADARGKQAGKSAGKKGGHGKHRKH